MPLRKLNFQTKKQQHKKQNSLTYKNECKATSSMKQKSYNIACDKWRLECLKLTKISMKPALLTAIPTISDKAHKSRRFLPTKPMVPTKPTETDQNRRFLHRSFLQQKTASYDKKPTLRRYFSTRAYASV